MCKQSKIYCIFSAEKHKKSDSKRVKTKNIFLPKVAWIDLKSSLIQENLQQKFQAKMVPGLSLKIWSNFQAKSQAI